MINCNKLDEKIKNKTYLIHKIYPLKRLIYNLDMKLYSYLSYAKESLQSYLWVSEHSPINFSS